ncbi:hypothetical protein COU80_01010 [Candidatus Peregrinibacteria bacterium CG10_big_fil_rev_8_21_14_0_10_55_24]|nr:MAG: hypothetical protein COU80_01010 [Candidatus Peregrinibacteria bacterium CG10_big_fil_rev_8_21_14_0_10_55_24]
MTTLKTSDVEVKVRTENTRAVIEGKTAVSFQTLVSLILQRKIIPLFKEWGKDHVIVTSELLTAIASSPQDSQEDRTRLILVTIGVGILVGVFFLAVTQIGLLSLGIVLGQQQLLIIAGILVGLALLATVLTKIQRGNRAQKIADKMEKLTSLLSK